MELGGIINPVTPNFEKYAAPNGTIFELKLGEHSQLENVFSIPIIDPTIVLHYLNFIEFSMDWRQIRLENKVSNIVQEGTPS